MHNVHTRRGPAAPETAAAGPLGIAGQVRPFAMHTRFVHGLGPDPHGVGKVGEPLKVALGLGGSAHPVAYAGAPACPGRLASARERRHSDRGRGGAHTISPSSDRPESVESAWERVPRLESLWPIAAARAALLASYGPYLREGQGGPTQGRSARGPAMSEAAALVGLTPATRAGAPTRPGPEHDEPV